MDVLTSKDLDSVLARAVREKQPVLGICLGCQILLDRSEEHDTKTLGLVHGETLAFPAGLTQEDGSPAPVPHMGWNSLNVKTVSYTHLDVYKRQLRTRYGRGGSE